MEDLPDGQFRRLDRMRCERHYLLDVKNESSDRCVITVSGSTGNIYTIIIDKDQLTCNCPDFDGLADVEGWYCKHCCFVIYRVIGSHLLSNEVEPRNIQAARLQQWRSKLVEKTLTQMKHVISPELCKKFAKMKQDENGDHTVASHEQCLQDFGIINPNQCKRPDKLEDMCGVCCEDLKGDHQLIECGECLNVAHKECIDIWLRNGTVEKCVYCRATLVYALYLQNQEKPSKKRKIDDYKNILE